MPNAPRSGGTRRDRTQVFAANARRRFPASSPAPDAFRDRRRTDVPSPAGQSVHSQRHWYPADKAVRDPRRPARRARAQLARAWRLQSAAAFLPRRLCCAEPTRLSGSLGRFLPAIHHAAGAGGNNRSDRTNRSLPKAGSDRSPTSDDRRPGFPTHPNKAAANYVCRTQHKNTRLEFCEKSVEPVAALTTAADRSGNRQTERTSVGSDQQTPDRRRPAPVSDRKPAPTERVGFARTVAKGPDRDRETPHYHPAPSSTSNSRTIVAAARAAAAAVEMSSQIYYRCRSQ